jgi:hypothetical protein
MSVANTLFSLIGFPTLPQKGEEKFYHDNSNFNQNVKVTGNLITQSNSLTLGEKIICGNTYLILDPFNKKATLPNLFVSGSIFGFRNLTISNISIFNNTVIANRNVIINGKLQLASCGDVARRIDRADKLPSSDIRLKENITPIENALEKISKLNGVEYDFKDSKDYGYLRKHQIGLIAQEVEKVIPEVVSEQENGNLGVSYQHLTAMLVEAVKEQQSQIDSLKKEIETLKNGESK